MPRLHDAAVLFIDHQVGLFNLVQDTSLDSFKYTILAVGDTAKFFDLKIVMTTSREDGPNGSIMPKLKAKFPNAPYVARPGQINAWDDPDFFKAMYAYPLFPELPRLLAMMSLWLPTLPAHSMKPSEMTHGRDWKLVEYNS
ncbi:hypothetical protein INT44_005597 [Umbelopsis vinacea]|uniref:Isochorismatase-like domain-containing protein n=1 Tax=Umbelopsis vinacea TaxID=44442 RepID=A0A8H7UK14_9FUNG|nr:hypothetical protein INT44_005597 [Umbelopsis vinacea]